MRRYALAVILGIAMVAGVAFHYRWQRREIAFTPAEWRAADQVGRGRMVYDLLRSGRLLGLGAAEVQGVLGPPDWLDDGGLYYKVLRYDGFTPFDTWAYILDVEVDQTGRVTAVYLED